MAKYRVPVRIAVAPVQTFQRTIVVEAGSPIEAARLVAGRIGELSHQPGWRAIDGRLGPMRPDKTEYHAYLDEDGLAKWAAEHPQEQEP